MVRGNYSITSNSAHTRPSSEKDKYSGQVTQKKNDIPLPVLVLRPQSPYKMLDVLRSEYNAG